MFFLIDRILIHRPVEDVFTFISDYHSDWKWRTRRLDVHQTDSEGLPESISTKSVLPLLRQKISARYQILDLEPNQRLISKIDLGKVIVLDDRRVRSLSEDMTEFEYSVNIDVNGMFKLFQPMKKRELQRDFNRDLIWLKELLEILPASALSGHQGFQGVQHPASQSKEDEHGLIA